ncbi:50S ribosome-binding GTPase, partial [Patescibacteria group bacterium]|nr:50S ribosome-binding GTPase [Patescibacteria group bacterium]
MSLQVGLVGFPNVGKSTLFNALLQAHLADSSNYPFCTIDPNVGVVKVPDARLKALAKIVGTNRIVNATIKFIDIAGIVEGAHKGLGLGNKFLSHIREVDVLVFVLRDFIDENVKRVGSKSPADDFQILMTELELADLEVLQKQKAPKINVTKQDKFRWQVVTRLNEAIAAGTPLNQVPLTDAELFSVKSLALLTLKPIIIVLNSGEKALNQEQLQIGNYPTLRICA